MYAEQQSSRAAVLKLKRYEVQQKVGIGKDTYSGMPHSIGISTRKEKDEKEN